MPLFLNNTPIYAVQFTDGLGTRDIRDVYINDVRVLSIVVVDLPGGEQEDVDVADYLIGAGYTPGSTLIVRVPASARYTASSTSAYALTCIRSDVGPESRIEIAPGAIVRGRGGRGGNGGNARGGPYRGFNGAAGGPALHLGRNFLITNNGDVRGGGGGGGGSGGTWRQGMLHCMGAGGGGGAGLGAGGNPGGGRGGNGRFAVGGPGQPGTISEGGRGGTRPPNYSHPGGNGGAPGQAGADAESSVQGIYVFEGGSGGAAGANIVRS